ncbi:tyrosine-type recombinase/integrase [Serratia marcescens]|uniref:tyrosine-type recombinase/integrase n=1 Tax=Serratia marcescens TaxID=615 RepID=UPI00217BB0D5|nr:tyrosine-type recombinase/integrase [Serratia marcescens]CAI1965906.1 Tyrosine recombinase XerC [Serratia marcescens]
MKPRKYLTSDEVFSLLQETEKKTISHRDYCMIYMAYIHGLRASELTGLTLSDYDPLSRKLRITRLKGGFNTIHPVIEQEHHLLQRWLAERHRYVRQDVPWLFITRTGQRLSRQRIYTLVRQYGNAAQLPVQVHPHMLRHACGYSLAERGNDTRLIQDYLGHRNIRHTVIYTASNAERFHAAWNGKSGFEKTKNESTPLDPKVTSINQRLRQGGKC